MQYSLDASRARFARGGPIFDSWKDRISDRLEGLRDERRTNSTCRVPAAEGNHPPPKPCGDGWRRQQVARKVDDVLQVVTIANTGDHEGCDCAAFEFGEPDRSAYARMKAIELFDPNAAHSLHQIGLHKAFAPLRRVLRAVFADIESGV